MTQQAMELPTKGSLANVPKHLQQFVGGADAENEVGMEDMIIPRLGVAQAGMSPQLKKQNELYIEDLEAGQLFNTVTNEVYGEEVELIPLFFTKNWIEFAPDMGGVLGQYKTAEELPADALVWGRDADNKPVPPRVTEFKNRMCLIRSTISGNYEPILVSFKKGEVKFSDQWNSQIKLFRAADKLPCFGHTYTVAAKLKHTAKGEHYVKVTAPAGFTSEVIFKSAQDYFNTLKKGGYTVDTTGIESENVIDAEEAGDTSFDAPTE
jgi:hypothetical protein